jgi:hypothetical protein
MGWGGGVDVDTVMCSREKQITNNAKRREIKEIESRRNYYAVQ